MKKYKHREVCLQEPQFWQFSQCVWDRTSETVQVEIQAHQASQIPKVTRNWSSYVIAVEFPVTNSKA